MNKKSVASEVPSLYDICADNLRAREEEKRKKIKEKLGNVPKQEHQYVSKDQILIPGPTAYDPSTRAWDTSIKPKIHTNARPETFDLSQNITKNIPLLELEHFSFQKLGKIGHVFSDLERFSDPPEREIVIKGKIHQYYKMMQPYSREAKIKPTISKTARFPEWKKARKIFDKPIKW